MFATKFLFKLFLFVGCLTPFIDASDDIADYLWTETKSFQQAALNSTFVQGLKNASLDPSQFGAYMVQDALYMYLSTECINVAIGKTLDADLKQFLQEKAKSYESLYLDLFKKWHIDDPRGINLGSDCQNYLNHLRNVANTKDPIYLVVAMIPCVKLWPWLGDRIGADSNDFGVYTNWVKTDFDPDYKGFKLYEDMVNNAYREGTVDKDVALTVYQASMKGEVDFFSLND